MAPKLLDLFCCQGGAGMGYHRAGFEVTGVDLHPQKRYPFTFIQGDALEYLREHGHEYDVIHASPPCQAYSESTPMKSRANYPKLIGPLRSLLQDIGQPYIIENVEGARSELVNPIMLCGTMFGLPVWRHRYFEMPGFSFPAPAGCDHRHRPVTIHCGSNTRKTRAFTTADEARKALGVEWMSLAGVYECIPPAYTQYLGQQIFREWNQP